MNPIVRRRIDQIRRRWWVVLLLAGIAMLLAVLPSLFGNPKYVASSTLALSASGRSPLENAPMVVGYVTLFNEKRTIDRLRAKLDIPEEIKFEARTVAASPILTIEARAENPEVAQDAAENMAMAFRDDINSVRKAGFSKAIENTRRQLDELLAQPGPEGYMNPLAPIVQTRLDQLQMDSTNQLEDLQPRAGVIEDGTPLVVMLGMGAVGGSMLGILAALGLAALSTRIANSADLRDKTGIDPLVEVPAGGSIERNRLREDRLRTLANIVSLQDSPKSTIVALTDARGARGARDLAEALARLSAQQEYRTVLVHADNNASQQSHGAGFNDVLADTGLVDSVLKDSTVDSLKIILSGSVVADRYSLVSRERIVAVFDELRADADTIVIVAPSITDTVDSQPICAAADFTIVVVDRRSTRIGDVTSAVDALSDAHAVLLGAVLMDEGRM